MNQPLTISVKWSLAKKIAFRFFCLYFLLYILPFPINILNEFSYQGTIAKYYYQLWDGLVPWVGHHVLLIGKDVTMPSGGSDKIFNYVEIFSKLILAAMLCLIWTLTDRKRNNYNHLFYWLTVYVRYFLAFIVMLYGIAKFFHLQFSGFPDLDQLVKPYGESSPMGLLWRFMGYSTSYKIFTGAGEVLGGLLLLFRRTTTLGALVLIAVLSNVVMLNLSYDVSVKIHPMNLLLMAFFLLAIDIKRVINFFLLNKAVPAIEIKQPFTKKWMRTGKIAVKMLLIVYLLYSEISQFLEGYKKWVDLPNPPLYGIYNIETFVKNKDVLPPLTTDTIRWRRMIVSGRGVNIQLMNDSLRNYVFEPDTLKRTITIFSNTDTLNKSFLTYHQPEKDILILEGKWKGDSVFVRMKKFDINNFRLVSWKMRWINRGGSKNF